MTNHTLHAAAWQLLAQITASRHRALNWLAGFAPGIASLFPLRAVIGKVDTMIEHQSLVVSPQAVEKLAALWQNHAANREGRTP